MKPVWCDLVFLSIVVATLTAVIPPVLSAVSPSSALLTVLWLRGWTITIKSPLTCATLPVYCAVTSGTNASVFLTIPFPLQLQ